MDDRKLSVVVPKPDCRCVLRVKLLHPDTGYKSHGTGGSRVGGRGPRGRVRGRQENPSLPGPERETGTGEVGAGERTTSGRLVDRSGEYGRDRGVCRSGGPTWVKIETEGS